MKIQLQRQHRKYEKYKSTGIPWIPEIPDAWRNIKLKYCSNILNGYAFNSDDYQEDGLPILRIGDVGQDIDFTTVKRVPCELRKKIQRFRVKRRDVLLALTGATIGKSSVYNSDQESYLNQRVGILRGSKSVLSEFLKYFVATDIFQENIRLACFGGAQENIGKPEINNIFMSVPGTKEQATIANYLDEKTALLDQIIASKRKQIELLKEKRNSLINRAVKRGLDQNVEMKDSGVEWIGEVPKGWEVRKLKYSAKICNGSDFKEYEVVDGGYAVIGSGGVFARVEKFIYDKPSVLLGRKGTIDKPLYIEDPFWTVDTMFYTKVYSNTVPKFLYYQSLCIDFSRYQYGSALPSMTQSTLLNILLSCPPKEEQREIVTFLDSETQKIDQTIASTEKSITLLEEYKTSLISNVVTGKIKISNNNN